MASNPLETGTTSTQKFQKVIAELQNSNGDEPLDSVTGALTTISYEHHEIHSGTHFYIRDFTDVVANGTVVYTFIVPDTTTWSHIKISVKNEIESEYLLQEGISTTGTGTAVNPVNRNRNSTTAATLKVYKNAQGLSGGTAIAKSRLGNGRTIGDGDRDSEEIILKQGIKYYFLVTNRIGSAASLINITLDWYEHINKA